VERTALLQDEASLSAYLYGTTTEPLPADLIGVNLELALSECYARMDAIGVSTAETRARKILTGLGFSDNGASMDCPTVNLSGGWAMRAALAAALYVRPHLLLLDEVRSTVPVAQYSIVYCTSLLGVPVRYKKPPVASSYSFLLNSVL
jgi:hypothetical protein